MFLFFILSCYYTLFSFLFFLMIRRPPRSTLFPYTTLFRSGSGGTITLPLRRPSVASNLIQAAFGENGIIVLVDVVSGLDKFVAMFNEQPFRALAAWTAGAHTGQDETSFQLLAIQPKFEIALGEHGMSIAERFPSAQVPDHYGTSSIITG